MLIYAQCQMNVMSLNAGNPAIKPEASITRGNVARGQGCIYHSSYVLISLFYCWVLGLWSTGTMYNVSANDEGLEL